MTVVRAGHGGGIDGNNRTYIITDTATGRKYFVKFDGSSENIDAELAGLEMMRAMGVLGVYSAERHDLEPNGIVMAVAGGNLNLSGDLKQAADGGFYGGLTDLKRANYAQLMSLGLLDALLDNPDRHSNNWLVAVDGKDGLDTDGFADYVPLIIDNGLGLAVAEGNRRSYPAHKRDYSAVQYITKGLGRNGIARVILAEVGQDAFDKMVKISLQQAIQALAREYPPGAEIPGGVEALIGRAQQLINAQPSDWKIQ
jgi:hypothetical protein